VNGNSRGSGYPYTKIQTCNGAHVRQQLTSSETSRGTISYTEGGVEETHNEKDKQRAENLTISEEYSPCFGSICDGDMWDKADDTAGC